jgi:hypothetical protein
LSAASAVTVPARFSENITNKTFGYFILDSLNRPRCRIPQIDRSKLLAISASKQSPDLKTTELCWSTRNYPANGLNLFAL